MPDQNGGVTNLIVLPSGGVVDRDELNKRLDDLAEEQKLHQSDPVLKKK